MNSTAGEQWEFDGISNDGTRVFVFGFYRDPNYSFFGTGNLRLYAEFASSNGSRYAVVEYAEESTVEWCPDRGTRGVWRGPNWVYTFETNTDMSLTTITMDDPEAKATITMQSIALVQYADNRAWPDEQGNPLTVPHFYWIEPVPVADLTLEAVIMGEAMTWEGMGGPERLWGAFNWFTCLKSMMAIRLHVGPFALSLVEFGSHRQRGLTVPSVLLVLEGQKMFESRSTELSLVDDFFQVRKIYNGPGATTQTLEDKVTGIELILTSPSRKQSCRFVVTHKIFAFEYVLGEGRGGTAYAGTAEGGLLGSMLWGGPAFTEVLKFPKFSMLLRDNYA
ncbi:Uu.00g110070.m01.CDS01 [Anthostomella pinea]|uniref:Uu.00g110070.m01.CDS01 n=1 Tax=Anthostomella pinea TaxID=933095 RepID=A0AAI8YG81_9PEZI|nr:Uu.00g110070.m01.CDS01 [Anthostomella pinea]